MCCPAISLAFSILPFPFALVVLGLGLRHHPTPLSLPFFLNAFAATDVDKVHILHLAAPPPSVLAGTGSDKS